MVFQIFFVTIMWTKIESSVNHRHRFSKKSAAFFILFFQKSLCDLWQIIKTMCWREWKGKSETAYMGIAWVVRARFYRGAIIRRPAHSVPSEILLGSAFPKPCLCGKCRTFSLPLPKFFLPGGRKTFGKCPLKSEGIIRSRYQKHFLRYLTFAEKMSIEKWERKWSELPLSYVLSWYEQKAVCILLTLLHHGIKNIRLGPSLPAFVSPNILKYLVENFGIAPITTPEEDLKQLLGK